VPDRAFAIRDMTPSEIAHFSAPGAIFVAAQQRLQRRKDALARDALDSGDFAQDGVERADAQRFVIGHRDAVMLRRFRLQK